MRVRAGHDVATMLRPRRLSTFDGALSAVAPYHRPDRFRSLEANLGGAARIARGGGYSFVPASFGGGAIVQDMTRFDRVLGFDPGAAEIEVEAGITLEQILRITVPHGLWLPVQPGYPRITVGGCIATNVNSKNSLREGCFVRSVIDLTLFHPRYGVVRVDPEAESRVFGLTCGGFGLTGIILRARLRLARLPGATVRIERKPVDSLVECLTLLRSAAARSTWAAYAWHDGWPGRGLGRGILYEDTIVPGDAPLADGIVPRYFPLSADLRRSIPVSLWQPLTAPLINAVRRLSETIRGDDTTTVFDALFPFAREPWYYFLFGRRGLAEAQIIVPHAAAELFVMDLATQLKRHRPPSVMISLKLVSGAQRYVRFDADGVCVTLNLVRGSEAHRFLSVLDEMTLAAGGIPNVAKDPRLPRSVVDRAFPEADRFREDLRAYDPERRFRSALSEGLSL